MTAIPAGEPSAPVYVGREQFLAAAKGLVVRPLRVEDEAAWRALYPQFAEHYTVPVLDENQSRVWQWLMDPDYPLEGIGAYDSEGRMIGLAHFRPFPRPLSGTTGCFLDDLLVDRAAHGSGAADALMHSLRQICVDRGWTVVRWITADDNFRARRMYDRFALRTMWVTYDMAPGNSDATPRIATDGAGIKVRPVAENDKAQWRGLYSQYAEHYRVAVSAEHQDVVWSWLMDPDHPESGIVAETPGGELVGLAHFRPFTRPLAASEGCFLDDLLVDSNMRGSGAVDALLDRLRSISAERQWTVVRWITADDNHRARSVYDKYSTRTMWVIYDMTPGTMPSELSEVLQ